MGDISTLGINELLQEECELLQSDPHHLASTSSRLPSIQKLVKPVIKELILLRFILLYGIGVFII